MTLTLPSGISSSRLVGCRITQIVRSEIHVFELGFAGVPRMYFMSIYLEVDNLEWYELLSSSSRHLRPVLFRPVLAKPPAVIDFSVEEASVATSQIHRFGYSPESYWNCCVIGSVIQNVLTDHSGCIGYLLLSNDSLLFKGTGIFGDSLEVAGRDDVFPEMNEDAVPYADPAPWPIW